MTLWTIVPEELIFASQNDQQQAAFEEVDYYGQKVIAERMSPTQLRVVRILSTDPADYLHGALQPGTVIAYKPVIETLS